MTGVRRAFAWASLGRYAVLAVNLLAALVLARLLSPRDYGVSTLSAAVIALAEGIRALGGGSYLVQRHEISDNNIRASFTVGLLVTIILTMGLIGLAPPLARYFDLPELAPYLRVAALGFAAGAVTNPISALLARQMAFDRIAILSVLIAVLGAIAGTGLALLGFGAMSLAWAGTLSSLGSMLLYLRACKDLSVFRPLLSGWRSVLAFGAFDGATTVLAQIGESVPFLILGRLLDATAIGIGQRAVLLCLIPERVILAGVGAVALPALSRQAREGQDLKADYVRALELISGAQWPALLTLAFLADPIVLLVLGPQWRAAIPLVQILSIALLFSFPISLHYPAVVAVGAIRAMPPVVAIQVLAALGLLTLAAEGGLRAAALSMLLVVPFNASLSVLQVRHFIPFSWSSLARALGRSAIVSAAAAAGPAFMAIFGGPDEDMPMALAMAAGMLAGIGGLAGLWVTNHPLLSEMLRAARAVRKSPRFAQLFRLGAR